MILINALQNCVLNASRPSETGENGIGEPTYSQSTVFEFNVPARLVAKQGYTAFNASGNRIVTDGYFLLDNNYGIKVGDILSTTFDNINRRVVYVNPIFGVANTIHHYEIYFVNIP